MAGHRHRTNKIKRMHSIIQGLLPTLEMMAENPDIAQITPGRISANRRAGDRNITVQYFTTSGMKLLARNPASIQEVFVVTSQPEQVRAWLMQRGLIQQNGNSHNKEKQSASIPPQPRPPRPAAAIDGRVGKREKTKQRNMKPPSMAEGPTDAILLADHLSGEVVAKMRQLRDTTTTRAASAKAEGRPSRPSSAPASPARSATGPPTAVPRDKAAKPQNPLEEWLAKADDETFRRLARRAKGHS